MAINVMKNWVRRGTISTLMAMLMNEGVKYNDARSLAKCTKRDRSSNYKPHYGKQAAARNLRHAKAGTHGLRMSMGHIVVG